MWFYGCALLIVLADQVVKFIVHALISPGQSILIYGLLKLTYVRNTGAAFSIFSGFSPQLALIGLVIIAGVLYMHYQIRPKEVLLQIALALVLGGSFGNLIDRIFRSYVVDYIDFTIWPVFNLADIMINVGVALILLRLFMHEHKKRKKCIQCS
jgi:signal peptidase II